MRGKVVLALVLTASLAAWADEPVPKPEGDRMKLEGWWDIRFWRDASGDAPPAKLKAGMDDFGGERGGGGELLELEEADDTRKKQAGADRPDLAARAKMKIGEREPKLPGPKDKWGGFRWPHHWYSWTMTASDIGDIRRIPADYKIEHGLEQQTGCWLRRHFTLPADWKGRSVSLRFPKTVNCDPIVYLNGRRIGIVNRPGGEIDVTAGLKTTGEQELVYFITWDCQGITRDGDYSGMPTGKEGRRWMIPSQDCPYLVANDPIRIDDLFCNTSWRRKMLTLEVDLKADKDVGSAVFEAEIADADGKTVKTAKKPCAVKSGGTSLAVEIPWEDPITWEIGRGYLYTCRAALKAGGRTVAKRELKFGFREIWREGKEIMMNGHVQRLRVVCLTGSGWGADFLRQIGYNCILFPHGKETTDLKNVDVDFFDREGIACICAGPQIAYGVQPSFVRNESVRDDYAATMRHSIREHRNHPSIVAMYLGVNAPHPAMPVWMMWPRAFGMFRAGGEKYVSQEAMNLACDIGHGVNPSILFYGHADGNDGDIASMNIYPNFMPLQEREEWLKPWSEKGVLPVQAAEFGEVYWLSWHVADFNAGFNGTEYTAIEYGDDAYRMETDRDIQAIRAGIAGWGGHIGQVPHESVWKHREELVRRTHRSWRTYGVNGGMVWFNLVDGYGSPSGDGKPSYSSKFIPEKIVGKPKWANRDYDIFRQGNFDFMSYLGGAPEHTDKTHAYFAGETVEKQVVLVWDGFGERTASVQVRVQDKEGNAVFEKKVEETLRQGDIRFVKIEFPAPDVKDKAAYEIRLTADCPGFETQRDVFPFEVYAHRSVKLESGNALALYDPQGETAKVLDAFGVKYTKITDLRPSTRLVIGRFALGRDKDGTKAAEELLKSVPAGARLLVMAQYPSVWQAFGLAPEDTSARRLFARAGAFAKMTPDYLAYWRGAPYYSDDPEAGHLMKHRTLRGPRCGYHHTVAGFVLQVPDVPGYRPLVDGEYDLNYAGVMRWWDGSRDWLLSTLDLEGRVGVDPAATRTAEALLREFLSPEEDRPATGRKVIADGRAAERLAKDLPSSGETGEILLVGPGAGTTWKELQKKVSAGANALVYANPRLMREAGFTVTAVPKVYRFKGLATEAFRGVSPALLRARDALKMSALSKPPKGWTLSEDGFFSETAVGKGKVVYCALDPYQIADRYQPRQAKGPDVAADEDGLDLDDEVSAAKEEDPVAKMDEKALARQRQITGLSSDRARDLFARLLTNLGAAASAVNVPRYRPAIPNFDPYVYKYW